MNKQLWRVGIMAAAFALLAATGQAEQLFETDGLVLSGTITLHQRAAASCRIVEDKYTEEEYAQLEENEGKPLDVWVAEYSVYNGSGKALDHLIALVSVEVPVPQCTYWDGAAGVPWGGHTDFIQETAEPYSVLPGETVKKEIQILAFHTDTPKFHSRSLNFTFAEETGQRAAARTQGTGNSAAMPLQNARASSTSSQDDPASTGSKAGMAWRPTNTCEGKPVGSECWMELADQPGCFVWETHLALNQSAVTWTGTCTDGLTQGTGTLIGVWGEEQESYEAAGRIKDGKMNGNWIFRGADGWVNEGPFVDGKLNGNWIQRDADGTSAEGSYVDGQRNGNWVVEFPDGRLHEGPYVDGKKNGNWVFTESSGDLEKGSFLDNKWDGEWTHRNAKSGLTVVRTFRAGELVDLRVDRPAGRHLTANPSGSATVTGAFGITLGSDLAQLKNISHPRSDDPDWNCLDQVSLDYGYQFRRLNDGTEDLLEETKAGENWILLDIENPPNPIPGGSMYQAQINVWDGRIMQLSTYIKAASREACDEEESRLEKLLEDKYGQCIDPTYKPNQIGVKPIGQCDANGLIERRITASCLGSLLNLQYNIISDVYRMKIIDAWMRIGRPSAEDL